MYKILPFSFTLFCISICVASYIDIKTYKIFKITWILPLLGALVENYCSSREFLVSRVLQSLLIFLALVVFRYFSKKRFGLGDVYYISALTMSLGLVGSHTVILVACIAGVVYGMVVGDMKRKIPFAPFIAVGMISYCFIYNIFLYDYIFDLDFLSNRFIY
ncbi:MAG: DUF1751 domain-containing protein [Bacilli bacterium]|nr:DUF1751 domain-containing protein [Bacilli bacterium]